MTYRKRAAPAEDELVESRGPRGPARRSVVQGILGAGWAVRSGYGGRVVARPDGSLEDERELLLEGVSFVGGRYIDAYGGPVPGTRVDFVFDSGDHRDLNASAGAWGPDEKVAFERAVSRLRALAAWFGTGPEAAALARVRQLLAPRLFRKGTAIVIDYGDSESAKAAIVELRQLLKEQAP